MGTPTSRRLTGNRRTTVPTRTSTPPPPKSPRSRTRPTDAVVDQQGRPAERAHRHPADGLVYRRRPPGNVRHPVNARGGRADNFPTTSCRHRTRRCRDSRSDARRCHPGELPASRRGYAPAKAVDGSPPRHRPPLSSGNFFMPVHFIIGRGSTAASDGWSTASSTRLQAPYVIGDGADGAAEPSRRRFRRMVVERQRHQLDQHAGRCRRRLRNCRRAIRHQRPQAAAWVQPVGQGIGGWLIRISGSSGAGGHEAPTASAVPVAEETPEGPVCSVSAVVAAAWRRRTDGGRSGTGSDGAAMLGREATAGYRQQRNRRPRNQITRPRRSGGNPGSLGSHGTVGRSGHRRCRVLDRRHRGADASLFDDHAQWHLADHPTAGSSSCTEPTGLQGRFYRHSTPGSTRTTRSSWRPTGSSKWSRLGMIWAAVEPEPGVFDHDYLASIAQTVRCWPLTASPHPSWTCIRTTTAPSSAARALRCGRPADRRTTEHDYGFPWNCFLECRRGHTWDAFWSNRRDADRSRPRDSTREPGNRRVVLASAQP